MSHTLDHKTKRFYVEMGYTESQVLRAYDYAKRYNVDMLDALNTNIAPASSPSQKLQNHFVDNPVMQKLSSYTFLLPLSKIKISEYEPLYSRSGKHNQLITKYQLREQNNPVGLLNVSNCCYLNSLLQCYFLMNDFKISLLTAEPLDRLEERLANQSKTKIKRIRNQYELLKKLKNFFTLMALTSKKYMDPSDVLLNLVDSVGEKISYGEEKDLSEINIMIIERLSEGLSYTKKYYNEEDTEKTSASLNQPVEIKKNVYNSIFNPKISDIKRLFYGTKVQYYDQTSQMSKQPPILSDFAGIILNPRFATLYRALDQEFNFKVQINGKSVDKHTFIREQPEYLFMYINRTQYDRQQGHMLKTEQKFTFDFIIYMDRYMQKYRKEKEIGNDRIKELIINRNKIKEQMNYLQILFKKLEECYRYAKELEGWEEKLPREEEFESQYANLSSKLNEIQAELKEIESRKEEYHLMYIFVHRGDAVSGHYWGYGRNGGSWYRFDINCRKMQQEQIIIDMQKSSGTPYALLYVKPDKIPCFQYQYHLQKQSNSVNYIDFRAYFDAKHREEIIIQNMMIHQEIQLRWYENIKKKAFVDYMNRYSGIKRIVSKWKEDGGKQKLNQIAICNNFSLFLCSKGEYELSKFSVFEQAILFASNNKITIDKLLRDQNMLGKIQKKFRKSCQGLYNLKHYALLQKQLLRYEQLQQQYQLNVFEVLWGVQVMQLYERVAGELDGLKEKAEGAQIVRSILNYVRIRNNLMKTDQIKKANEVLFQPLYVAQINNQISRLILLKLSIIGIKLRSLHQFLDLSDAVALQIATINSGNVLSIEEEDKRQNSALSCVGEARELVGGFYQKGSNKINLKNNNKLVLQKKSSGRSPSKKLTFQSTILGSPVRSPIKTQIKEISDKKQIQSTLTTSASNLSLLLCSRQIWKVQELQNIKINYDFAQKLMNFLKKVSPILPLYRKIAERGKALTVAELRQEGVELNQPKYTESLI